MNRAALYLRSSKDRHDVSIDAQRRQLAALCIERNLVVVTEFADAVERADDADRPGLRALLLELKSNARTWDVVVMLDTARLARQDQGFAFVFDQECQKRNVRVVYKMLPETHPVMDVVFRQVTRAWDVMHSLMSREKGLAGMAENVRQGHRAGGRAPFGYRLRHTPTGATRDGSPVMKSCLELADEAPTVAAYLKARAAGIPRLVARERAGLTLADTSLIGIEWNALTYAGNTVWNVHAPHTKGGGYVGGQKRRPRAQWVIQSGTHPALITQAEAETVLRALESPTRKRARRTARVYLLSGLLTTPAGLAWHGGNGYYRAGKGRSVPADRIERAVLEALSAGLQSDAVVEDLVRRIRALRAPSDGSEVKRIAAAIRELTKKIDGVSALLAETSAPQALLRSIEAWEAERTTLLTRKLLLEERAETATRAGSVRPADVRRLVRNIAEDLVEGDRATLKDAFARLVESVTLDPTDFSCTMRYRIAPLNSRDKLASPRDFEAIPGFETAVELAANRAYRRAA